MPVGTRFPAPVQTGPGAHPVSCTMGTGSFPGVKSGRGVTLTPHPLLVLWSTKSRAIPLLPLWAVRPVQSLSACTRVHCTLTFITYLTFGKGEVFWHAEHLASWYILIITAARCTNWNRTLHVSESSSVHHHESRTVHTATGIQVCHTGLLTACDQDQDGTGLVLQNLTSSILILLANWQQTCMTYSYCCVYSAQNQTSSVLILLASCRQTCMTYTYCCVYNEELLMMDRETVRNM